MNISIEPKIGTIVLARNPLIQTWVPTIYGGRIEESGEMKILGANGMVFTECLPLEGNEHLSGTRHDPSQKFFKDQLVAVRNSDNEDWLPAIFIALKPQTINSSNIWCVKKTENSEPTWWKYCKPAIDIFHI